MDFRQLEYLVTIAEEANFTRAAEKLFVSQPALTQQMQKLEKELNTEVFDRSGRQIRLTPSGEILYRHAQSIFREIADAQREVQELQSLERGTLHIGVVQTVNAYLMPTLVAQFRQAYDGIHLIIQELAMDEIEQGLEQGKLQLGIGFLPTTFPNTEAEGLFSERLVLVTNKRHALADKRAIPMAQISGDMVLLSQAFCTRRLWDDYAKVADIHLNVNIEMNTVHSILETLQHTNLVSVLPELALQMGGADGLVGIPIHSPIPERTVSLLWRRNAYRSLAARTFAEMMRKMMDEQYTLASVGD